MLSNYLKKLQLPASQRLTSVQLRCIISEHTKKSIFGRKPIKEKEEVTQEGEKVTPFFGTGFEQAHYIRIKERAKHMDEVHEKEGVLNEERKENSDEFEGFENEGDVDEKDFTKRRSSSGVYS